MLGGSSTAGLVLLNSPSALRRRHSSRCGVGARCCSVGEVSPELEADDGNVLDIYGRPALERDDDSLGERRVSESVVKVYCVHSGFNPQMPWANKPQEEATGSGFAIDYDCHCILTNAHVVADATYIEVRKAGDARKYVAQRRKVSHECDLATLTVGDASFWQDVHPLPFGSMPCLQDEVSVVGYPEGGEGVSITAGVVSRIEIQRYAHSGNHLLAIQIDAAINPGNSGGPALDEEGQVIGVAFQNHQDSQNIGYMIPVPTIRHFLADEMPGDPSRTQGFCSLGIFWQALDNAQLRDYKGLGERSGVMLRGIVPTAPASEVLERGDVLLELEGRSIANDGTIAVGQQERLSFQHPIHLKFPGELVKLKILRQDKELELEVPVRPLPKLVPPIVYDNPQPYFLYAGLVFVPLHEPYLHEWGDDWMADAPPELVHLTITGIQSRDDEQPVILSRCFPSKETAGYLHLSDRRVLSVNGERVLNLRQMYELVWRLHKSEPFLQFEVQCVGGSAMLVIDTSIAEELGRSILETYRIPRAASAELDEETRSNAVAS